jgi:molecular chaperone GrpE
VTVPTTGTGGGDEFDPTRPRFTDKRRVDPETGAVREPTPAADDTPAHDPAALGAAPVHAELEAALAVAAERLEDLQRLQAEYVNYRKRVERDRLVARDQTVFAIVDALLGVLDDVDLARQHGELADGPFAAIADKLETALGRFGWERYGATGEPFDPNHHEALMHALSPDVDQPTVVQVLQPGHRVGERIVRAARVAVAEPGE